MNTKTVNAAVSWEDDEVYVETITRAGNGYVVKMRNFVCGRVGKLERTIKVHDRTDFIKNGYTKFLDACFAAQRSWEREARRSGKVIGNVYIG